MNFYVQIYIFCYETIQFCLRVISVHVISVKTLQQIEKYDFQKWS